MRRRSTVTVLALVLVAGTLALADLGGRPVLVVVLWPSQVLLAWLWLGFCAAPSRGRGLAIAATAALVADVVLAARSRPSLGAVAGVLAMGLLAAVLGQLLRANRTRVTDVLAAQVSAVLLVTSASTLVALRVTHSGAHAGATGLVSLAAAAVAAQIGDRRLPSPTFTAGRSVAGVILALGAAAGVGAALQGTHGVVLGAAAGAAGLLADLVVAVGAGTRRLARPLGAVLPLATVAPALYVTSRVLLG